MEMQMEFIRQLPKPAELKEQFPLDDQLKAVKQKRDDELAAIFRGEDKRFILVIGPCSADREDAVLEYMDRMKRLADEVEDKLYIVPRCYTNKPRTKGSRLQGHAAPAGSDEGRGYAGRNHCDSGAAHENTGKIRALRAQMRCCTPRITGICRIC